MGFWGLIELPLLASRVGCLFVLVEHDWNMGCWSLGSVRILLRKWNLCTGKERFLLSSLLLIEVLLLLLQAQQLVQSLLTDFFQTLDLGNVFHEVGRQFQLGLCNNLLRLLWRRLITLQEVPVLRG